jgi:GT2 family glycosyltransferase
VHPHLDRLNRCARRGFRLAWRAATWPVRKGRLPKRSDLRAWVQAVAKWYHDRWLARYTPPPVADPYQVWLANHPWNARAAEAARAALDRLPCRPLLSVVMPVYNPEPRWLEAAVASVRAQVYPDWELCIADDASTKRGTRELLQRLAADEPRIRLTFRPENGHISRATNSAAELATGEYLVFLDQDDELSPDCLLELAKAALDGPDVIYSDDDKIDPAGRRYAPQFKPDWSPELLLSYMYLSHAFALKRSLFEELGGLRTGFEGCQDYDLALRAGERAGRVAHVPQVLYHWRSLPTSTAASGRAKPAAFERGCRAVQEALARRGAPGTVTRPLWAVRGHLGVFQIDFPDDGPEVTVVIPTRNRVELLRRCVDSLLAKTSYRNFRVLVIDNDSDDPATLAYLAGLSGRCRVLRLSCPSGRFNYAWLNNRAVEACGSEFVLFLNNDTEVRRPEWLGQMVGFGRVPGVGAVGAKLLYPGGQVQHAGVVNGFQGGLPAPAFRLAPAGDNGYLSYAAVARNYGAVTAACLLARRDTFLAAGGFDEERFAVAYNDIDLCQRLVAAGLRCVFAPRAELTHYEGATRGFLDSPHERRAFRLAWGGRPDPYYSPHLSLDSERFDINTAGRPALPAPTRPVRVLLCGHNLNLEGAPLFHLEAAEALQRRGRVRFEVCSPFDGPLAERFRRAGIPVHVIESPLLEWTQDAYNRRTDALAGWMRQRGYDLAWCNTLLTFFAVDAAKRAGLPSVWSVHESVDWLTFFDQFGEQIPPLAFPTFAFPYRVVFMTNPTRRLFDELNTAHHFSTIPPVLRLGEVDQFAAILSPAEAKAEIGCPADRLAVTVLGTVCPRKGQLDFVRAAAELLRAGRRGVRFYVVGCRESELLTPYLDRMRAVAAEFPNDIELVPETDRPYAYLRASDVAVCSSYNESFPRVTQEALAFRLPLVTTPVYGIQEQVAHPVSALCYEPGDVPLLAAHLGRLMDGPAQRRRLGEAGRAALETLPPYEEAMDRYEELLLGAYLAGGPAAPEPAAKPREPLAA